MYLPHARYAGYAYWATPSPQAYEISRDDGCYGNGWRRETAVCRCVLMLVVFVDAFLKHVQAYRRCYPPEIRIHFQLMKAMKTLLAKHILRYVVIMPFVLVLSCAECGW